MNNLAKPLQHLTYKKKQVINILDCIPALVKSARLERELKFFMLLEVSWNAISKHKLDLVL